MFHGQPTVGTRSCRIAGKALTGAMPAAFRAAERRRGTSPALVTRRRTAVTEALFNVGRDDGDDAAFRPGRFESKILRV